MSQSGGGTKELRFVGADEMFVAYRAERRKSYDETPISPSGFREELVARLAFIEAHFLESDWPSLGERVAVDPDDENAWCALPVEWGAKLDAEGLPATLEVPGQYELGLNYISRRVEPLSVDYWLIGEARKIQQVLGAADIDSAAQTAFDLGRWAEQGRLHARHLPAVRKRRKQARPLKETNDAFKAGAAKWKRTARAIAQEIWARNPAHSATAVCKSTQPNAMIERASPAACATFSKGHRNSSSSIVPSG
jgi:hypothetical protein